ncbi:hypothetical protein [Legionella sp. W05-934-2]|uniref:hypothetical protein n=1 Tax=Legionella sp. W05-934-2 TaxID=1198649 RepID=UPI00346293DA
MSWIKNREITPVIFMAINYLVNFKNLKKILKAHQIDLIILPEDIVGDVTPLLVKAGHKLKIPSIILPYTIANQREAFESLKNNPSISMALKYNRIMGKYFKSWVMEENQHQVLRLPAGHVIGHLLTKTSPPDPWMMNSSFANIIGVENTKMFEYYQNSGIPASKMVITGACYDDELAHYLLNKDQELRKLHTRYNLNKIKPILLIGGFPNQLVSNPPGFDFESIEAAVDFIYYSLRDLLDKYHIIVRPHPNYPELSHMFEKKGFISSEIDTLKLVALSDIYIAFASATIRWAISCGIPSINYDIFHYNYGDYASVRGVINVESKEDFAQAIININDKPYLDNLKNQLQIEKLDWGNLDGHSSQRIHQLIQQLLTHKKLVSTNFQTVKEERYEID